MSLKETLASRFFSLLYLATHELDVSLSSATAEATLGSFLSMLMVLLTFWITSSVSLTYSSSEAARAAGVSGKSHTDDERVATAIDKNSRRRACGIAVVAVVVAAVVLVTLIGTSDLSLEVGVTSVGEAMIG